MLMQSAMIIGGLTTLIQLFPVFGFGVGLPTVMGVAFAYMPILTTIGMQYGISAIFGVQLVAAFASIFIGMFIGKIRKFFPPIVCGTVVLAIGLSLYNTAINYFGGGSAAQAAGTFGSPQFWILALVTLAVTLVCSLFGKGYVKVSGMIIGVGVGYVVALIMGGIIDFAPRGRRRDRLGPIPLHFGLEFHPDAIIMMILMYIVQAVQTIGDVSSTTMGGFGRDAKDNRARRCHQGPGYLRHDRRPHRRPAHRPLQPERWTHLHRQGRRQARVRHRFRYYAARRLLPQAHVFDRHRSAARTRRRYHHGLCGDHAVRYPAHFRVAAQLNRR